MGSSRLPANDASTDLVSTDLVLGVDPGLANTGWALLDGESQIVACGTVRTRSGSIAPRLLGVVDGLRAALHGRPVREAALEQLFWGSNATSAVNVAQARGALLASLCAEGIAVHEYTPAQVKAVLTGYGSARKQQMMRMVRAQVRDTQLEMDDHAADAAAIAICHVRSRRLRSLAGGGGGRTLEEAAAAALHDARTAPRARRSARA